MNSFFMVWSPQGRPPTYRHTTVGQAQNEAEQLLRQFPHQEFFVLEAISKVEFAPEVRPVVHTSLDDIPF